MYKTANGKEWASNGGLTDLAAANLINIIGNPELAKLFKITALNKIKEAVTTYAINIAEDTIYEIPTDKITYDELSSLLDENQPKTR